MAEPFGAAARAGELDPFAMADEQLKVPRELLEPYEASQQVRWPGRATPVSCFPSTRIAMGTGEGVSTCTNAFFVAADLVLHLTGQCWSA
jgi:hypothetical protein